VIVTESELALLTLVAVVAREMLLAVDVVGSSDVPPAPPLPQPANRPVRPNRPAKINPFIIFMLDITVFPILVATGVVLPGWFNACTGVQTAAV